MKGRHLFAVATTIALSLMVHTTRAGAEPTKIQNCTTITEPGSYELANNLETCKNKGGVSDCLVIATNFVTIDLRGFEITFCLPGTAAVRNLVRGDGITDDGAERKGIVVRDGTVSNLRIGINLRVSEGAQIDRMRVFGNTHVGMTAGRGRIVTSNTVCDNGSSGIQAGFDSTVSGNTASDNGFDGIQAGFASTVSGNTARDNHNNGILAVSGSTSVSGNTTSFNGQDGIRVFHSSTVSGNTANGNAQDGIDVVCPSNVIGNTAASNVINNLNLLAPGLCNIAHNLAP